MMELLFLDILSKSFYITTTTVGPYVIIFFVDHSYRFLCDLHISPNPSYAAQGPLRATGLQIVLILSCIQQQVWTPSKMAVNTFKNRKFLNWPKLHYLNTGFAQIISVKAWLIDLGTYFINFMFLKLYLNSTKNGCHYFN